VCLCVCVLKWPWKWAIKPVSVSFLGVLMARGQLISWKN